MGAFCSGAGGLLVIERHGTIIHSKEDCHEKEVFNLLNLLEFLISVDVERSDPC